MKVQGPIFNSFIIYNGKESEKEYIYIHIVYSVGRSVVSDSATPWTF